MSKSKDKINESCIKIFKLISLLYEDNATYGNVIEIFKDELSDQSNNNLQVVLNKYMNTLKVFGIKVIKENNKYKIDNCLYSMDYTIDDIRSISILINSSKSFPDEECSENIKELIRNLTLRMDNENKNKLNNLSQNYNFSFYYADLKTQLQEAKKACKGNQQVEVFYKRNKKQIKCKCQPKEIIYSSKTAYLEVYDIDKHIKVNIPISNIFSIHTLHSVANTHELPITVTYKLKNRLAKTYKLKTNENSPGYDAKGNLIIINRDEPIDHLLARLMRYSYNCEIVSPKYLRDEMIDLINETLKNYE